MSDRPEDRADRVETVLESGDLNKAMQTLKDEMAQVSDPNERAAVLNALQQENKRRTGECWTLPNVTVEQNSSWGQKIPGEYNVKFSQNILQQAMSWHPLVQDATKISRTLEQANNQ